MVTPKRQLGDRGEAIAARYLEDLGLAVEARNVRTPSGEIDLIVRDGNDLVFVEVRTRRSFPGAAAESLEPAKLARMWRCAMEYCEANGIDPDCARVDAVVVDLTARGPRVEHLAAVDIPEE